MEVQAHGGDLLLGLNASGQGGQVKPGTARNDPWHTVTIRRRVSGVSRSASTRESDNGRCDAK